MADVIDKALMTHAYVAGALKKAIYAPDQADPAFAQSDRLCAFGHSIYGPKGLLHCGRPEDQALRRTHTQLHVVACAAVGHCRDSRRDLACKSVESGDFFPMSTDMKRRLLDLGRVIYADKLR